MLQHCFSILEILSFTLLLAATVVQIGLWLIAFMLLKIGICVKLFK
jgi:hypothetical protein